MNAVTEVKVERPVYQQEELNQAVDYSKPHSTWMSCLPRCNQSCQPLRFLKRTIPVLDWLPKYQWRDDFLSDVISGATVAVMHIPQGMAYAMLGNVPPIIGLYMAFIPVLVYFFFGTSRHVSMGTFAVVCLMTGKTVLTHATLDTAEMSVTADNRTEVGQLIHYTPIQVATAVTFMVGVYQLLMYVLRLGIFCTLLSETLVNGFTTGAAIHVLTSQLKDLLGMNLTRHKGAFKIVYTYYEIVTNITKANPAAITVSAVTITILLLNNELAKPWLMKFCRFPIPIELLVVVGGTLLSNYADLHNEYNILPVGEIPTGLPYPTLPTFSLMADVALDSFTTTMVAYTISMSMALIFAQKFDYEVDPNQELLAQGSGNLVGSFFSCMPFTASLSRSLIQQTVGGKTQLASIVSCCLLLVVLLWVGPFFEPLPRAVLASIIVVALKGMLIQVADIKRFWHLSRLDGAVWISTFLTVVFVDIDYGLLTGICLSVASMLAQGIKPYICILGVVPNTDLYLDVDRYKGASEMPGIKILHYCGGLNFANQNQFKNKVYKLSGLNPQKVLLTKKQSAKNIKKTENCFDKKEGIINTSFEGHHTGSTGTSKIEYGGFEPQLLYDYEFNREKASCLIFDFSALSYIDPSAAKVLRSLCEEFSKINIAVYLAGISGPVYEQLAKYSLLSVGSPFKTFPTIHDAVLFAGRCATVDNIRL